MDEVMNLDALFQRVNDAVDRSAYITPTATVAAPQRAAIQRLIEMIHQPLISPTEIAQNIDAAYDAGEIDSVHRLSCLHVLAASPNVRDYNEASRLCAEQEREARRIGGPHLDRNLASVARHRGVLAYLNRNFGTALSHFFDALEREPSVENVGNVLCALLALDARAPAEHLMAQCRTMPRPFQTELQRRIAADPDLAALQMEAM